MPLQRRGECDWDMGWPARSSGGGQPPSFPSMVSCLSHSLLDGDQGSGNRQAGSIGRHAVTRRTRKKDGETALTPRTPTTDRQGLTEQGNTTGAAHSVPTAAARGWSERRAPAGTWRGVTSTDKAREPRCGGAASDNRKPSDAKTLVASRGLVLRIRGRTGSNHDQIWAGIHPLQGGELFAETPCLQRISDTYEYLTDA